MKSFVFVLVGFVLGVAAAVAVPVIGQGVFFQDPARSVELTIREDDPSRETTIEARLGDEGAFGNRLTITETNTEQSVKITFRVTTTHAAVGDRIMDIRIDDPKNRVAEKTLPITLPDGDKVVTKSFFIEVAGDTLHDHAAKVTFEGAWRP